MKKTIYYIAALLAMVSLVLFIPYMEKAKESNASAASTPLVPPSSVGSISDALLANEGDALDYPYLKNGDVFQEYLKVNDYAGISDSIVSVMQCLKDSIGDPGAYYDNNTRHVLNTLGFGDKDVFITFVSAIAAPPSFAEVAEVKKKEGYFYVVYKLFDKNSHYLCELEANHLFMNNRYAASEYRLK